MITKRSMPDISKLGPIILLIIFFIVAILILGADHIKGIITYASFMTILMVIIFFIRERR